MADQSSTVRREILEDRYDAVIDQRKRPGDFSRLGLALANDVAEVIARTARCGDIDSLDGADEAVLDAIREAVLREIEARGLATPR